MTAEAYPPHNQNEGQKGQSLPLGQPSFIPKTPLKENEIPLKRPSITPFCPYVSLGKSGDKANLSPLAGGLVLWPFHHWWHGGQYGGDIAAGL